jgi:Tfp pilus assembly protein PilN
MQIQLNLATRPYFSRQAVRLWLFVAGGFLLVLLAMHLLFAYQNFRQYRQIGVHLAELDQRIAEVQGIGPGDFNPQAYDLALEQVSELNRILEADRFRWTLLLSRLEELVPDDVSIRSLQPDFENRSLKILAFSRDVQGMKDFLDAMLRSEDMHQAFLQNHQEVELNSPTGRSSRVISFGLEVREAF